MSPEHERLHALWRERWPQREPALVAFVELRPDARPDLDELRGWLAQLLPAAMLPARIVGCDTLPRTPAGKVDRAALRLPATEAQRPRIAVPPATDTEHRLLELFGQVLGTVPASIDDDFFAHLGGHSLLATQLASLIRQHWPITFELRTIFEHPSVAGLAARIDASLRSPQAVPPQASPAAASTAAMTAPIPRRQRPQPPTLPDGSAPPPVGDGKTPSADRSG
ncbi:MAG: phosphopantetheine-binding protein [Burkholderiaceae bacterium]